VKDHRYVDELTIEELEAVLRLRRRQERIKRLGNKPVATDPLAHEGGRNGSAGIQTQSDKALRSQPRSPTQGLRAHRYSAVVEDAPTRRRERRPIKWRWVRDQFLLFVEILALLGLVWVILQMVLTVDEINEQSRSLQIMPTLTVTPMIRAHVSSIAYVLPGGHTPPDASGRSEPLPIPPHLRDLVAAVTPMPVPTPGPEHARRIVIPVIDVDAPVVEGDDWESLKKGAGHTIWSANPGERGNCIISAHNDIYGEIFRDLPDLSVGDEIVVYTNSTSYRYQVEQMRIVRPTPEEAARVMGATSSPVLTLVSCYPYGVDTHRIIVIASLVTE
jgi:sortase A